MTVGVCASALRPHDFGGTASLDHIVNLVAFLERQGLDATYTTGADIDARGFLIPVRNRAVLFVGHDENWSKMERDHIDAAEASGVALVFWGANQCYRHKNLVFSASTIDSIKLEHPGIRRLLHNVLAEATQSSHSWKTSR